MQRLIKFSKFRNIGLEKDEYLVLNSSFKKGEMGNLIVLIGANNSGKSNVLDGIKKVCDGSNLSNRDLTNLYFEEKYKNPHVSLILKDEDYEFELKTGIEYPSRWEINCAKDIVTKPSSDVIKKSLLQIRDTYTNYGYRNQYLNILVGQIEKKEIKGDDLYSSAMRFMETFKNEANNAYSTARTVWNAARNTNKLIQHWEEKNGSAANKIQSYVASSLGIASPTPKVVNYVEKNLNNSDLFTDRIDSLNEHKFFNSLFKAVNIDVKTIQNAYDQYRESNNTAVLNKLRKQLQPKVEKLNTQFNKLYFASNDQYKFTLDFESKRISFGMARGKEEDPINLEYQSTGFRWFFDLYFNFLAVNGLNAGDIVIMDEPATNLHPQGQKELRAFIKDFAIQNDILFIIATHSPFLIDSDNYDELRVISTENNRSKIDNRFTAVNLDDPDSLLPIKEALTIKQNVLYDLETEVVWVEGITDYNYLTMFKKLLGFKNLSFLPFNGVGSNSQQTKKILEKLLNIKFHKRSLLVDGDKAGKDMYGQAKNTDFGSVISLSQIKVGDKPAVVIEDLFSDEDKKKYQAIGNKNSYGTSIMKDHCKLSDFSKSTVEHFKELFVLIEDN